MDQTNWRELNEELRYEIKGRVLECNGPVIRASLPGAAIGDRVQIGSTRSAKLGIVTGYNKEQTSIVSIDGNDGIRTGAKVQLLPGRLSLNIPENSLGLALSPSGEILDGSTLSPKSLLKLEYRKVSLHSRSAKTIKFNSGVNIVDSLLRAA